MQLNLPVNHLLDASQNILIAGAGGGFDIYAGLPLYFQLRSQGKNVHLANYSFVDFTFAKMAGTVIQEIPTLLIGAQGKMRGPVAYYPEGYLAEWFLIYEGRDEIIWMFDNPAVEPLKMSYKHLVKKLNIDTLILVDGGVDSLMRGDEQAPGSLLEDTISLVAIEDLDVPTKLLVTIGFGTEVEEGVCHHHALENIAALTKAGAFYGTCSLLPHMEGFDKFEAACRYAWDTQATDPEFLRRSRSHISTRIIPAARGEFGDYRMYQDERVRRFISPLMNIYWFFDAMKVLDASQTASVLRGSLTKDDARSTLLMWLIENKDKRPRVTLPY
jgi:hypothetical protein